jgi:tetratricopeptide (TPR) repeat protein
MAEQQPPGGATTVTHLFSRLPEPPTCPVGVSWVGTAFVPAARWPTGHVLLDDFEVQGVLGQGGMGDVYAVRQRSTGQTLAVKRARLGDPGNRRRFLAELQLWIDLPEHPHLAACRFFRTIGDEVVIFTDLAEGGSLAHWIAQGRLTLTEDVLDVAIQVGEGLHALHECGLVHQDVKPANVLMNAAGAARVSDFGLARARARVTPLPAEGFGQGTLLVTGGGMTPAYCSPEQKLGRPVSRRTDIWSWGVLVLEMFLGRSPCCDKGGHLAATVHARCRQEEAGQRMPPPVHAVLECCFSEEPQERWATLADAVDVLLECRGRKPLAGQRAPLRPAASPTSRSAVGSGRWDPPRRWLAWAFQADGRDPTEVEAVLPPAAAGSRAQAVADLSVYEEARGLFSRLVDEGRDDLRPRLAELTVQKALVHLAAGDSPGAEALFDQAVSAWQQLIHGWGRPQLTPNLVAAYLHQANALRTLGQNDRSVELCDKVIRLWQGLGNRRARRELRDDLATAHAQKGSALRNLGRPREAAGQYDRAIELWEQLCAEGNEEPANDLAGAYLRKASVLATLGEPAEALELCDRALQMRRRMERMEQPHSEAEMARALLGKAGVLRGCDRARDAVALYEQAIARWERLVEDLGRDDLAHELARAYLARANADRALGCVRAAADGCARAAAIWERLVQQEGRRELTLHLAGAYLHQANALRLCKDDQALACADRGLSLYERLVHGEGRLDLGVDLARAYVSKAHILRVLAQHAQAVEMYDRALELRRRLMEEAAREDVENDMVRDRAARAELLVEMGDVERGKLDLQAALPSLEEAARRTRRKDLEAALTRARKRLAALEEPGPAVAPPE